MNSNADWVKSVTTLRGNHLVIKAVKIMKFFRYKIITGIQDKVNNPEHCKHEQEIS
jgi:hypothetical protein